jgi:hypothetical protein
MSGKWTDITDAIERFDQLEHHFGIQLGALSAFVSGPDTDAEYTLKVHGELRMVDGEAPSGPQFQLMVIAYDDRGRVIKTDLLEIRPPWLLTFQIVAMTLYTPVRPAAIRIYPLRV